MVLSRPALSDRATWRLLIVPGSGCHDLAPSFPRMFAAAPGAHVLLLQKPHLGGTECGLSFLEWDRLSRWRDQAIVLSRQALKSTDADLPLVLAGLSEGAELLPSLADAFSESKLLLMVGNAGLDPSITGALQAARNGVYDRWQQINAAVELADTEHRLIEGRSAGYWRDLRDWRLSGPLMHEPRPLLHVWGGQDRLVPQQAYQRFASQARVGRSGFYCAMRFVSADHELREPEADRLQALWRALDAHWRTSADVDRLRCEPLRTAIGATE